MNHRPDTASKTASLSGRLEALDFLNDRARKELAYHEAERDKYKKLYHELSTSTSWRLLSPFYKIRRKIKHSSAISKRENPIQALRFKLLSLGFIDRAYKDLESIAKSSSSINNKNAAWELALWHADKYTAEDAVKTLEFLSLATKSEHDKIRNQRAAILESEAHMLLGDASKAKECLENSLKRYGENPDTYLALANVHEEIDEKYKYVNKAIENSFIMPIGKKSTKSTYLYDSMEVKSDGISHISLDKVPLVSVIIPVYNAEDTIHTALDSLLQQTWPNIEILVSDDCSTDSTTAIVQQYSKKHSSIRLIKGTKNSGPYVARNLALNAARGEFITCNDSDDWTHPEKIQKQAEHLISNPDVVGNMSQQARLSNNFIFHRRGNPGYFIQSNMSSFLFRKSAVTVELGYWDSVRFGADSEFIRRLRQKFGERAVVTLSDSLFSFQRKSDESLTGDGKFGYHGFLMGARKEYHESQIHYHSNATDLSYKFPMRRRPFSVPVSMLPERVMGHTPHYDIIFAADFRLQNKSTLDAIKKYSGYGLRIGLINLYRYELPVHQQTVGSYRELANSKSASFIVYGEEAKCTHLVFLDSHAMLEKQIYHPDIKADSLLLDANGPKLSASKLARILGNISSSYGSVDCVFSRRPYEIPEGQADLVKGDVYSHLDSRLLS